MATFVTIDPIRIRSVSRANAANVVHASRRATSGAPSIPNWSITQALSRPIDSAKTKSSRSNRKGTTWTIVAPKRTDMARSYVNLHCDHLPPAEPAAHLR